MHKYALFDYGGRPVIYGDKTLLEALPNSIKYLWVRYNPIPSSSSGGYPLDFTHEREWRCVVNPATQYGFNMPSKGIPLLLPWDASCNHDAYKFRIIVSKTEEVEILRQAIYNHITTQNKSGLYWDRLTNTQIIPLNEVNEYISQYNLGSIRIEDWIKYKN